MTFVGPAPAVAGMSSKESWRLLKQSYVDQIRGPGGSTGKTRPSWVNLNHTVVYLGDPSDTREVLAGFDAETLSKFKHVALAWHISQFGPLARACQRLATTCPALCTIIIQWCESAELLQQSLTLETAAYYADIPAYTWRQLEYQKLDTPYFRSQLLQYFGAPPPRLHLLAPDSGRGLP